VKRRVAAPRPDWRARVEAQGLLFHSISSAPGARDRYWLDGVHYELSAEEIDAIDRAAAALHSMCIAAAADVIARGRYDELGVPAVAVPWIEASWRAGAPSLYGRMDLALGPDGVPKLLEYNADTPTSLLEAAVIQWSWLEDTCPARDQWNQLHERLIAVWRAIAGPGSVVHFAHVADLEDEMTVGYLRDTAAQAGLTTVGLSMDAIGWDERAARLVDLEGRTIDHLFKLYPWEGIAGDAFAPMIARASDVCWLEPAWKMLLSTKAILPVLWEMFPEHPNLLPASRAPIAGAAGWVKKPLHGREGQNVTIDAPGVAIETSGAYGVEGWVYQQYVDLGCHDGMRPVLGAWIIAGEPAGLGIRECEGYVTDNTACFAPHLIA
jgi:glutathionylspermidine synthase